MEQARKRVASEGALAYLEALYDPEYAFISEGGADALWDDILAHAKDSTPEFTRWRNRLTAGIVPRTAHRILEVGVGSGQMLELLASRRPRVELYGIDVSAEAIADIRRRFEGHFAVARAEEIPWPGIQFDAILMLEVLEHIEVRRTFGVLRALCERLAPDGWLILSVPLQTVDDLRRSYLLCPHCAASFHPIGHVRSYSELQPIRSELALAGFSIERMRGVAGGRYLGVPRQWLMHVLPTRVKPMVMIFSCRKAMVTGSS